jgi:hypothetical protein
VLPDHFPGIGRLEHSSIFYAVRHQHIGLTLAPVTGELISDLVANRQPRHDISAFDLWLALARQLILNTPTLTQPSPRGHLDAIRLSGTLVTPGSRRFQMTKTMISS